MNKCEQVSSVGHQMSVAGVQGPTQRGRMGTGPYTERSLYSEVQCILVTWGPTDTHTTDNIAFPQLRSRAVKILHESIK